MDDQFGHGLAEKGEIEVEQSKMQPIRLAVWLTGVGVVLWTAAALAFVPSCEEELAQAYPSAFVADLGACDEAAPAVEAGALADLGKFTHRLNGTWELNLRTRQGLPEDLAGQATRLYVDLVAQGEAVQGVAMVVQQGGELAQPAKKIAAFWRVNVLQAEPRAIRMNMSLGSAEFFAQAGLAPEVTQQFVEQKGIFVSARGDAQSADSWDRVVWMENSVTYISCSRGTVERYAKVSDQRPTIEGASLEDFWQKAQQEFAKNRRVAALLSRPMLETSLSGD